PASGTLPHPTSRLTSPRPRMQDLTFMTVRRSSTQAAPEPARAATRAYRALGAPVPMSKHSQGSGSWQSGQIAAVAHNLSSLHAFKVHPGDLTCREVKACKEVASLPDALC